MNEDTELEPDKMKSIRSVLDDIDLPPRDVFNDKFMRTHSGVETFDDFIQEGDWENDRGKIDHQVTVGDADELTDELTDYSTWHQFLDKALEVYWDSPRQNRRRHDRYPCEMSVSVEAGMDQLSGTIVDISKKGFRLKTKNQIPNTRTLKVQLSQEESQFDADLMFRGTIRWKDDDELPYTMGVEILSKEKF